jgi:hypothetical protein
MAFSGSPGNTRWIPGARLVGCAAAAAVALLSVGSARGQSTAAPAPGKQQCLSSYENTQNMRRQGKLRAAMMQAVTCAQESCPAVLRADCVQWHSEIERSLPTIVIAAVDEVGHDIPSVRVIMDGEDLAGLQRGQAIALDPGGHVLLVSAPGGRSAALQVVVMQGQKDRMLRFVLRPSASPTGSVGGPVADPGKEPGAATSTRKTAAWIAGGVGLVGLALSGYFGLRAMSLWSERNDHCPNGACDDRAIEAWKEAARAARVADVTAAVGVIGLGVGTYLFVTAPRTSASSAPASAAGPRMADFTLGLGGTW